VDSLDFLFRPDPERNPDEDIALQSVDQNKFVTLRGPESNSKAHVDGIYSDFGLTKENYIQSVTDSKGLISARMLKNNLEFK